MRLFVQLLGVVLFGWMGLSLLLQTEQANYRIVEYYIPHWIGAAIFLRIIAALFLTLAFLQLTGAIRGANRFFLLVLLIPVADQFLFLLGYNKFEPLFLLYRSLSEIVIQIHAVFLFFLLLFFYSTPALQVNKKWILHASVIIAIGLSFIRPIYVLDWQSPQNEKSQWNSKQIEDFLSTNNARPSQENYLVAFFTASSPHCAVAAIKLAINNRNEDLPQTFVVFRGGQKESEDFLKQYSLTQTELVLIDRETFFHYAGNTVPSVFYVTSSKEVHHYVRSELGYRALDYIRNTNDN